MSGTTTDKDVEGVRIAVLLGLAEERISELTLERDTLRTMIVEIYQVARRELYRLRALPAQDVTGRTLHEIEVLARFVKDAQEHVELIGQIEDTKP